MTTRSRPFAPEADTEPALDLLLAGRDAESAYRYPTVWRLRQLLSSRLWEPERDARVWEANNDGALVGLAHLWRRRRDQPGSGLEYVQRAEAAGESLDADMLDWAKSRTRQLTAESGQAFALEVLATEGQTSRIVVFERMGFARKASEYNPYYALTLNQREYPVRPPNGYTVRPLAREERGYYERLFGFTSVSGQHRDELIRSPEYAHFVAVSPDGALVGYCECSYSSAEWEHSGQRVAWVDYVGVHDSYLRRGLGSALMCAGFERMRDWGAETAVLVTSSSNTAARALYEDLGMRVREREYVWIWQGS